MGTNFYAKHIPTELEYARMQEALTNRELDRLRELLDRTQKEYHIGKRSGGWQFLFAPHIKLRHGFPNSGQVVSPWENTLESIKEYLSRPDVEIRNEYGEIFTPEQFWNEEIGYCLYNDSENYINSKQYYEKHPQEKRFVFDSDMEFTTEEGLRFSTDEDFCLEMRSLFNFIKSSLGGYFYFEKGTFYIYGGYHGYVKFLEHFDIESDEETDQIIHTLYGADELIIHTNDGGKLVYYWSEDRKDKLGNGFYLTNFIFRKKT